MTRRVLTIGILAAWWCCAASSACAAGAESVAGAGSAAGADPAPDSLRPVAGTPPSLDLAFLAALDDLPVRGNEPSHGAIDTRARDDGGSAKSPTKALLLSAVVPGLGQVYGGNPKLGLLYFGIEAAGWTGFSVWRAQGFEKRRESHGYADTHYFAAVYDSIKNASPTDPPNRDLPYGDIIEYYEDIGKLNEVIWGWDDVAPKGPSIDPETQQPVTGMSQHRELYQDMRHAANASLRKARNVGIGLFVNHAISAFHAFKIVKWTNKRLHPELSGYRIRVRETRDKNGLMLVVSRRF